MKLRRGRSIGRPFAILDIGSTKICCMIGEVDRQGELRLLGQGTHASAGMRAGEVTALADLSNAIGQAVQSAERAADLSIASVTVVLPGGSPRSQVRTQDMTLSDSAVSRRDIRRLLDRCGAQPLDPALQLMQLHPLHYSLDDVRGIADPAGMRGRRLAVDFLNVTALRTSLTNILEALALNHLSAERFIHAGYAAGLACLSGEDRDLGSTVIDVGGGTSSIAIFMDGRLIYADTVPVGGQHVTTDIARILSTPLAEAERLKAVHGSITPVDTMAAAPSPVREALQLGMSDNITLPGLGDVIEAGGKTIERRLLSAVIKPRIEEIIELLMDRMRAVRMDYAAGNRFVLTGGTSQLTGIADFSAQLVGRNVILGQPAGIGNLPVEETSRSNAAAVGALIHVSRLTEDDPAERQTRTLPHGPIERLGAWFRDNL
ncbi:MAG: cell division protein FtsA [Alphaproteobacteria bacterium]|nr:cell division protein FtsA [Alphaproteobacteria bacterium]